MRFITELTRRELFDLLTAGYWVEDISIIRWHGTYPEAIDNSSPVWYHGRLSEIEFLKRLYNLSKLPSADPRFGDAEVDILNHTYNCDWEMGWIFHDRRFKLVDNDEFLLKFVCEVFHPLVREEKGNWLELLNQVNELLVHDGYEIVEIEKLSGRAVYSWRRGSAGNAVLANQIESIKQIINTEYVRSQLKEMNGHIDSDSHITIGKAKELIETCSKYILDEQNITYKSSAKTHELMKQACDSLNLTVKTLPEEVKGWEIAVKILGNLSGIAQGMTELRNLFGDGHGKSKDFKPLPTRYAHLAAGAAAAAVKFMLDTYEARKI